MANINLAVTTTCYPDGKKQKHTYGMIPNNKPFDEHNFNVWRRWLSILKAKHHWNEYDEIKRIS